MDVLLVISSVTMHAGLACLLSSTAENLCFEMISVKVGHGSVVIANDLFHEVGHIIIIIIVVIN